MKAFADANGKSYHYFEASEVVGDLLVAVHQYCAGRGLLWPTRQGSLARLQDAGGRGRGTSPAGPGENRRSETAFDRVIAIDVEGDLAKSQRALARLGKARGLIAAKKADEAIKLVADVLQAADPEDVPLLAQAYNVLGAAQRQAGRTEAALLAFLHVDVLYASLPDAHAEALANLAELWEQVHKTERAQPRPQDAGRAISRQCLGKKTGG